MKTHEILLTTSREFVRNIECLLTAQESFRAIEQRCCEYLIPIFTKECLMQLDNCGLKRGSETAISDMFWNLWDNIQKDLEKME